MSFYLGRKYFPFIYKILTLVLILYYALFSFNHVFASTINGINDFNTYENSYLRISMLYPSNWTKTTIAQNYNTSAIAYFESPYKGFMNIVIEDLELKNITLDIYVEQGIDYLKNFIDSYNYTLRKITVGNITADRIEYKLSGSPNDLSYGKKDYRGIQVIMLKENKAYVLTYISPAATYQKELPIVEEMINSFKLLSVEPIEHNYSIIFVLVLFIFFIGIIVVYMMLKAIKKIRSSFHKS